MTYRIGVDVGGTFTDVAVIDDERGRLHLHKLPTTPADQSLAVIDGVRSLLTRLGLPVEGAALFGHGTTVATNALLEKNIARVGLVTTEGFRDLLEIARGNRPLLFDHTVDRPAPLVPRPLRCEVPERTHAGGEIGRALDVDAVRRVAAELKEEGVEAIAVCFLHSYANPAHEQEARLVIQRALPSVCVSVSSDVAPEFREFERLSTTVLNAALVPVMQRYVSNLAVGLEQLGLRCARYISQSNGGVIGFDTAKEWPVRTLFSGPAAGVTGAIAVARQAGFEDLLTFDMGGTSTDVCLVRGGRAVVTNGRVIEGYPVRAATMDVHSVGAGGGSLASVDAGGFLHVGPASAGADPGPACYGRGGRRPTVTDANLVLGRLNPAGLLDGEMALFPEKAAESIATAIAQAKRSSAEEAARGVIAVVNSNMVRALRVVSVERGYDPRDLTLVAFGGAGPLHACALARELGMRRILVPPAPGILCALGLLAADTRVDTNRTYLRPLREVRGGELTKCLEDVRAQLAGFLTMPAQTGLEELRWVDLRYRGQSHELRVAVETGVITDDGVTAIADRFHEAHRRAYGYEVREAEIQAVNVAVALRMPSKPLPQLATAVAATTTPQSRRPVFFEEVGQFVECPIYRRSELPSGFSMVGPVVLEQMDSTVVVPPDVTAWLEPTGSVILELH